MAILSNGPASTDTITQMGDSNKSLGALIDPMGHAEALSKWEYETAKACLELHRSDVPELQAVARMIHGAAEAKYRTFENMMDRLVRNLTEDGVEIDGLLIGTGTPICLHEDTTTAWLEDDISKADREYELNEPETLAALVKIIRAGGWFPDWLHLQIHNFVPGNNPMPSPLNVMGSLTVALERFQEKVEETREMLGLYPDEFAQKEAAPAEPPKPKTEPTRFQLTMVKDAEVKDPANITRSEFQELKKHLATMRTRKSGKGKKAA
jgi:hypothetical protein